MIPNASKPKVLLQGSDKSPLFTASRKDWMPNGLVEVRKKQPSSPVARLQARQSKAASKAEGKGKEVDIGPFVILGAILAATIYHLIPHH